MLLGMATDPVSLVITVIIVAAVLAVAWLVVTKAFGVPIPQWFVQVCMICLAAVVAVVAIRFLVSL